MEEKYENGNSVPLVVKSDDTKLIEVSKKFLSDIEEKFINFNNNYRKEYNKLEKFLNNKNFFFTPEKLSKKSPLTLINAPWGTGKTYFIENFVKLFIEKEIQSSVFKKIIIIDAWRFSNSRDVPMEFAAELSSILVDVQTNVNDIDIKKTLLKKLFNWMNPRNLKLKMGLNILGFIDIYTETYRKNDEETEKIQNEWKLIEENDEPIIIFIDNIERLGSYAWDLLKAVIKLQEFSNYLIILPLNIDKLSNNTNDSVNSEYPIEKYIDFNYYNFIQDYDGFFKTHIKDEEWIQKLNTIFNTEVNNKKLSIRELEQLFEKYSIFKIDDKYEQLHKINNFIWPAENLIKNIIKNDIDSYLTYHKKILKVLKNIIELLRKKHKLKWVNFIEEDYNNKLFNLKNNSRYLYNKNINYIDVLEDINVNLLEVAKYYKAEIRKKSKEIKSIENEIDEIQENLKNAEEKSLEYSDLEKKFINDINNPTNVYNENEHTQNKLNLSNINNRINSLKKAINEKHASLSAANSILNDLKERNEIKVENLNNFINEIKEIINENNLESYQMEYIDKFINQVMVNPFSLNNETFIINDIDNKLDSFWEILKKEN